MQRAPTAAFGALYIALCIAGAYLVLRGLGDDPRQPGRWVLMSVAAVYLSARPRTFGFLVLPAAVLAGLYAPVAAVYGPPDFQALISFVSTNPDEAAEFLTTIPVKGWIRLVLTPAAFLAAFFTARRADLRPWRNETLAVVCVLSLVLAIPPTNFFSAAFRGAELTRAELAEIESFVTGPGWGKTSARKENRDYVLVVGESVRRDFLQIYGYPLETTPFLAKAPATVVEGFTAADRFTVGSLRMLLTQGDLEKWRPRYDRNVIDLAKKAGFDTFWLSNQGLFGADDTPVSAIGRRARVSHFPVSGGYNRVLTSDFDLLPLFEKYLKEPHEGPRLFVLHTLGSHPDVCRRVIDFHEGWKSEGRRWRQPACYATSIRKTDRLLERAAGLLEESRRKTGRSWSMIWFSDHGLVIEDRGYKVAVFNGRASRYHLDVPLVLLESGAKKVRHLVSRKSGAHFTEGLAHWMGIRSEGLPVYDLFDGKDDPSDYGAAKRLQAADPVDDPAPDIRAHVIPQKPGK